MTSTHYGVIEKPEVVLGNVELVSDMRAAHERKSPVVNARKARCQNFESNFMREDEEAGTAAGRSRVEGTYDDDRRLRRETYSADRGVSCRWLTAQVVLLML